MLVFAARTGARVAEPVMAYPVAGGGALVATVEEDSPALSAVRDEELTDQLLAGVWRSVALLQQHRLGHGSLRPEHILVAPDGKARFSAFARAQLNAPPEVLGSDLVDLLATTAVRIGPRRATACALAGLGPELLASALPYLQPLALTGPARRAVVHYDQARARAARAKEGRRTLRPGGRPNLLRDLAAEISTAAHAKAVPSAPLARFTWKSVLGLAGAFLVLHLVLPQLANAPAAVDALRDANWWWVLAVLPITFLSQAFSTSLQLGTIPDRLPFGPTYQVQFASSFLNRITPSNVGGMALNLRYLQKTGIETGAATASVGLQTLAGALSNTVVAAVFFAWAGRGHAGVHLDLSGGRYVLWAVALALAAGALLGFTPPGRRFLHDKVWPFLRAAGSTVAGIATEPAKVVVGVVGALGLPLIQIVGLAMSLYALGADLPLRPGRCRVHGGPADRQRGSRTGWVGGAGGGAHRRSDDARSRGGGGDVGGARLPVADVLAQCPAGGARFGCGAAAGLRVTGRRRGRRTLDGSEGSAKKLYVHPNTVRTRLRRIADRTGRS